VSRLVLVRHGESRYNAERRIQGQRCAGLSEVGHAQADLVAQALAERYPDAALVASDLQRTRETVAPLEGALAREAVLDAGLRERAFGTWEGRLGTEVAAAEPDRWRRWGAGEDVITEVGGESSEQLADRVEAALLRLLAPDAPVTIAVTHGGPIWHGTHRMVGLPARSLGGVHNASVTELLWLPEAGTFVLDRWNEVGHLPAEVRAVDAVRVTAPAT
jgi:broad specificity phosphatase PhoE